VPLQVVNNLLGTNFMDETSIIMIAAGVLLLVTRGTMLVAPGPMRLLYLQSLLVGMIVRLSGLLQAALTGFAIMYVRNDRGMAADNAEIILYVFLAYTVLVKVLFAGPYSRGAKSVLGDMGDGTVRFLGLIAAGIGGVLVYYGYIWG
jgi:hypothetical protein